MAPGTEFARDFCAGIGPLQLGVVLVLLYFSKIGFDVLQWLLPMFIFQTDTLLLICKFSKIFLTKQKTYHNQGCGKYKFSSRHSSD